MKKRKKTRSDGLRRGIYILPNIFTSLNLFCGFYAVILGINGNFTGACVSVVVAIVFDIMDGKIARATHTTSKFGVEYDSLADLVSFGLAPAMIMYLWALKPLGRLGWLAAFLFMACGALRLARFNTQVGTISGDFFNGLPIPAGAGMTVTTVLFFNRFDINPEPYRIILLIMLYVLSFLMVSTIKYNSFKQPELFRKMNFNVLVTAILILIFIAAQPAVALFVLGLVYVSSGPVCMVHRRRLAKADITAKVDIKDGETEKKQEAVPPPSLN